VAYSDPESGRDPALEWEAVTLGVTDHTCDLFQSRMTDQLGNSGGGLRESRREWTEVHRHGERKRRVRFVSHRVLRNGEHRTMRGILSDDEVRAALSAP
jgi:hypothetical protein